MKNPRNIKSNTNKRSPHPKSAPKGGQGAQRSKPADSNARRPEKRGKEPAKGQGRSAKVKIDLYGIHAVTEAWMNPKRHIHALYITEGALDGFDHALKKAHDRGLKRPAPQIVDKGLLDGSTSPGSVHQGIGLTCQDLAEVDIHDMIRADENKEHSVLLMLDQVTDPHNIGAILRSACVFGASGVIMQKKHAPELGGVLAKTACGGVEHVPVAYETNLTRSIEALQEAGYFAIGLAEEGEDVISALPAHQKILLVLGAEGDGLRRLVREQCDVLTRLPTAGPISSLNVSNAAAVALYAVTN